MNIGTYLLDSLLQRGVQHIFGVPGDYVLQFDKLIEKHAIQYINATRENTAGYMADAYARVRGLGAVCITYGVGIGIANSIAQGYVEHSPIVLISGAPGTNELEKSIYRHHLINPNEKDAYDWTQLQIFKQITVDQAILNNPETAAFEINRVLESCLYHKRPVYIELPRNNVFASIPKSPTPRSVEYLSNSETLQEALGEIEELLQQSKSPLLWIGHEIQRYKLAPAIIKFAEKNNIPIVSTLLGKTVISEHHPQFVGVYIGEASRPEVRRFVQSCDCLFILGAILSDLETGIFSTNLENKTLIIADKEGLSISRHKYENIVFPELIQNLPNIKRKKKSGVKFPANIDRKDSLFAPKKRKNITVERMFQCLQHYLKPEHLIVTDIGDCLFGAIDLSLEQDSFLSCAYFSSLGFGSPGSVGAQIASPHRRVIGIIGDGAFQMTATELSTAVRYKLDPIIIVLNNRGYGMERPLLDGKYNDIVNWNYTDIPNMLGGGIGIKVKTEEEFENAFQTALKRRGSLTLIEVEISKTDFSPQMKRFLAQATKSVKGK